MKYFALIILSFIAMGSACNTGEKTACIDQSKIDPQAICTQQYDPVCGCNQITYGNACMAENAGVTSWSEGECEENTENPG